MTNQKVLALKPQEFVQKLELTFLEQEGGRVEAFQKRHPSLQYNEIAELSFEAYRAGFIAGSERSANLFSKELKNIFGAYRPKSLNNT